MMTEHGQWRQLTFRLSGSLHVGSGRWGFVLPCRSYLPGWTLWGALTVLLKKQGRWPGGYGAIGQRLNQECWLGHFFLTYQEEGKTYRYLPAIDRNQGGKTLFAWRGSPEEPADHLAPPTLFRHGTVRSRDQEQDSPGRLFLTETVQARQAEPYRLVGIIRYDADDATDTLLNLLQAGDTLRVGGNRQVSGAEIVCEAVEPCPEGQERKFLGYQHLYCNPTENDTAPETSALSGELERIVLRRTRTADGARSDGFGQHHVDWGCHLAPGWEGPDEQVYQPAKDERNGFRHGTVEPIYDP